MNIWETLGIQPTEDVSLIKKAYAQQAKLHHPEDDPEGFASLRLAYKLASANARGELGLPPGAFIPVAPGAPTGGAIAPEGGTVPAPPAEDDTPPETQPPPSPAYDKHHHPKVVIVIPSAPVPNDSDAPFAGSFHGGAAHRPLDFAFGEVDGAAARHAEAVGRQTGAFFARVDAIYDDTLTRHDAVAWRALLDSYPALYDDGRFVASFVDYIDGHNIPDGVMNEVVLPLVRQWRNRWLGTPQWTLFNRLEDPVARVRGAEQARASAFIAEMDALYRNKKTRGDVEAWQALFTRDDFEDLRRDAFFNRLFARFVVNRPDIPKAVWREVLGPMMGAPQREAGPLWQSFAKTLKPTRQGPAVRFIERHGTLAALVGVALMVLVLFLAQRGVSQRRQQQVAASSLAQQALAAQQFMEAQQESGSPTIASALPLTSEDWAALRTEEANQAAVAGALKRGDQRHTVAGEAEALGITPEGWAAMARLDYDEDAEEDVIARAVEAYHPVAARLIHEKVMPVVTLRVQNSDTYYWDDYWLYVSVGITVDRFTQLQDGYAQHGGAWLAEMLSVYDGFSMPVTVMMFITLPGGADSAVDSASSAAASPG